MSEGIRQTGIRQGIDPFIVANDRLGTLIRIYPARQVLTMGLLGRVTCAASKRSKSAR